VELPASKRSRLNESADKKAVTPKAEGKDAKDASEPNSNEQSEAPQENVKPQQEPQENEKEAEEIAVAQNVTEQVPISYSNCELLLDPSWKPHLKTEFDKPYFKELKRFLGKEEKKGVEIFPPVHKVFAAFQLCPWDKLKVVILGQDPYNDNGQAEGLCFSVPRGIAVPSSLKNIYKEAASDVKLVIPNHGSLIEWGQRGVLLLNTVLTVQAHKANSHKNSGWTKFTDAVIQEISKKHDGVVFILWGKQAQAKGKMIDKKKHRIVESPHPSGLSANRGFFGSKCFSKTNKFLQELGKDPIDWQISAS